MFVYTTTMTYTKHTTQNTNREHTMQRCGEKAPSLLLLPHHLYMVMTQSPKQGSKITHKRFHIRWFNLRCSMALLFLFGDSFERCVCVCRFWDACWLIAPTVLSKSGWFVRPIRLGGPRPGREPWCRGVVLSLAKTKSTVIAAALERYLFVCLFVFLTFAAIKLGSLCAVCGAEFLKCSKRTDVRI